MSIEVERPQLICYVHKADLPEDIVNNEERNKQWP